MEYPLRGQVSSAIFRAATGSALYKMFLDNLCDLYKSWNIPLAFLAELTGSVWHMGIGM